MKTFFKEFSISMVFVFMISYICYGAFYVQQNIKRPLSSKSQLEIAHLHNAAKFKETPSFKEKMMATAISTWDITKGYSKVAWDKTENYTKDSWDTTKDYSSVAWYKTEGYVKSVWGKTKEYSSIAWSKTKRSWNTAKDFTLTIYERTKDVIPSK